MIRVAVIGDIPQMQLIRNSVKENVLSDPTRITADDYMTYLIRRGKGWVHEHEDFLTGFAIIDVIDKSIWALFVHPNFEGRGVGKQLHDIMLAWYFRDRDHTLTLTTGIGTRAEKFYRNAGWNAQGVSDSGELIFTISARHWLATGNLV